MKMKTLNKVKTIFQRIFIVVIAALLIYSCKSRKETLPVEMTERNKNELLNVITSNALQYNTLVCKLKIGIKTSQKEKSVSSNASLKLIKDDRLQISIQPSLMGFSMEAFRMTFSKDSVIIVDRVNKLYVAESVQNIKKKVSFDFDLYNLQALFANQLFIAGKPAIGTDDYPLFSVEQSKYQAFINSKDRLDFSYAFITDYTDKIRSTAISKQKTTLLWTYDDFATIPGQQRFPMSMNMNLNLPEEEISMSFLFSKVDVDKETEINFDIPAQYRPITFEQAMKIIRELL